MKRDTDKLKNLSFDVLVIGGGIHGAATARECARRGYQTALIEQNDFGSATSANSLKIIHGGLRYLQHLNIKRMRESIVSRRIMSALAPHHVRKLPCLIPNSGYGLHSNLAMRIGLLLNDCIAFDRNRGVAEECRIPGGRILPLSQCKKLFPSINWDGMTGGSVWHDAIAINSDRLTLAFIKDAVQQGACAANYLTARRLLVEDGAVCGCQVTDELNGSQFSISAAAVVVTGGAWNSAVLKTADLNERRTTHWAKAVNVIVRKPLFNDFAVGLTGEVDYQDQDAVFKKKGRFFFFVPWRGYTMIGTTYKRFDGDPNQVKATRQDIGEILDQVNAIYPAAELSFEDVTNTHAGLVPMSSLHDDRDGNVQLEKETSFMEYAEGERAPQGLLSVKAVKFTTAPVVAVATGERLANYLTGKNRRPRPLLPAAKSNQAGFEKYSELKHLKERYGKEAADVLAYVIDNRETKSTGSSLYAGEIDFFLQEEMAAKLADVIFRRSELGTAECPPETLLQSIAEHMGNQLGWSAERIKAEIEEVKDHFNWN